MSEKLNIEELKIEMLNFNNLKDLQGDLKYLTPENYQKLKKSLLKHGFKFPFYVWKDKAGNNWIHDGHQRVKILKDLQKEGHNIDLVPCVMIQAENVKHAKELLLQVNSQYGLYNMDTTFFDDFDGNMSFLEDINIPDVAYLLQNNAIDPDFNLDEEGIFQEKKTKDTEEKTKEDEDIIICPHCGGEIKNQK